MEVGAVLILGYLLVGKCQNLIDVVEALGVDVPGTVSRVFAKDYGVDLQGEVCKRHE